MDQKMRIDSFHDLLKTAIGEVEGVFTPSTFSQLPALCSNITSAKKIVCYGVGREGLMMKSLAMRLMHVGLDVYYAGDMNVPPVGKDDLLLVSAGPGYFSTVNALVDVALEAHARVSVITAQPDLLLEKNYHQVVYIPAQTMANDQEVKDKVLPMGSLYEAALFLFFEIVILNLRDVLRETPESMRARHTNLE